MALSAKTNQLTGASSTGDQALTDPGFQPKALLTFHGLQTAAGAVANAQMAVGLGAADGTEKAAGYNSADNVGTTDSTRFFRTGDIIRAYAAGTITSNLAAVLKQMDASGFTLTWGDVTLSNALYNYLAIGGDDITNVYASHYALNTGTGDQAVTGVGFQPDIVIFIGTLHASNAAQQNATQFCFGVMDAAGNQWAATQKSQHNVAAGNTNRAFANDACLIFTQTAADNLAHKQSFVSMDADGFTVNISTAVGLASLIGFICIKGGNWKVGTETQKTSTGTKATTSVGFQPSGLILGSVCGTATSGVDTHARLSLGVATSPSQNTAIWTGDQDAADPTVANTIMRSDKCLTMATEGASASPTVNAEAELDSLDSDGFTLDWTTADATARVFGYVAFGGAGVSSSIKKLAGITQANVKKVSGLAIASVGAVSGVQNA